MKRISLLILLVAIVLGFGMTGCMTSEVRDGIALAHNSNMATYNKVAEVEKRVKALESSDNDQWDAVDNLTRRMFNAEVHSEANEVRSKNNEKRITAIEKEIPALKRKLLQDIGVTKLDTGKYSGAKRRWIGVGPFNPGSATAPVAEITRDIQEVTKSLGKTVIHGATFETTIQQVIGFFDSAPIKKSNWESNEKLALERAGNVGEKIGFMNLSNVSNNPTLFGEKRENNRYVYVLVKTVKVE